jgi:3-dehydroquinate synthetase
MGVARTGSADEIAALLTRLGLPIEVPPDVDRSRLMNAMLSDKKNRDGAIHAAFVASFGEAARDGDAWTHPLDLRVVRELLEVRGER